jgi:hypothetical protein
VFEILKHFLPELLAFQAVCLLHFVEPDGFFGCHGKQIQVILGWIR